MSETKKERTRRRSKSRETITIDEAFENYAPKDKQEKINELLSGIDIVEFQFQRVRNKYEFTFHTVISGKALLILIGGLTGLSIGARLLTG